MKPLNFPEQNPEIKLEESSNLLEPEKYAVILHNDDYTSMEFVIEVLMTLFSKATPEAHRIMLEVHQKGSGIAGIYDFEIAETKAFQVEKKAQNHGFPLKCSIQPLDPPSSDS